MCNNINSTSESESAASGVKEVLAVSYRRPWPAVGLRLFFIS